MEEVLGHVPKEQRLLYAVGVLLQSQTFPLSGVDLEKRLEELLELRGGKALAQELCVDLTDYPNVAQIEVTQLQHLVDEAADFVARQTAAFLQRLLIQYSGIPDLATSFKRASRDSHGLLHLVDLGPTPKKDVGACWVKTLSAIPGVTKEEVLQRLQMTAGQVRGLRPLPLSAALLRLANLPEQLIFDLRHRILSRHHSMSHIFETMAPHLRGLHGQGNLAKLILDDFRGSFQQVLDDDGGEDEDEAKLTTLFAACDTHQDGGIDQEELQQALSIAAPPANLSRLRTLAILQFGSWRAAFHSLGIGVEDPITEARFVALASNLDIAYEDAWAMFATLSPTGEPVTVPELSQHGSDFGLHEFALRVWLAGEAGSTLQDAAKRLHAPAFEGDLGLQRFREVCGLSEDGAASLSTASASLGTASKGLSSSKRIPSVKCHPPLTENEVTAAYAEFKAKYHSVTLGAIRSELESNTAFSNVLALDRSSASIGETMVVRYRVPHALQSQLREHPFIALVPSNMAWMSGGGGCWMIGRTTPVTEMTGPKFSLNRNGEGVLRLQVWPGVSHLELGAADLRIFASPDGMAIGRQVGSSAMFQLRPPAPAKIMIEAASLTPTSTRLLWEAPNPPVSRPATESQFRYVVRGKAMGLDIEQEAVLQEQQVWSHLKKSTSKFLSHQVHGLLPGVRYQFQVHAFSKSKRGSFVDNSPRAGGSAAMAAATTAAPEGLESLASPGVEVTMPERPAPPQPSHAILVERGLGGSFTLRWAEHESGGGGQNAWGYEVFWTVPQDDEEPETAQKHVDHEDAFAPGEKSLVWRYPGPVFFRKPGDGTVEGLLHPPEADAVPLDEVSFCVRAVDPFSSGVTSPMGDLGPAVPLPSAAEAILREAEAMKLIGEGAVRAGGFKRFLEEAEDAGLIGTGSSSELDLRRVLYKKVEEAGGLKEVIEAMTDLQMKSFKDACEIVKAIQESTELTSEETPSWTQVVRLVAEAGGAKSFSRSLSSVELKEVLGNTQRLAALGIFQGKSEDHSLRDALFNEDTEKQMPQLFSKIQEALSGLALDERQVADLSKALGIMARSGGKVSWTDLVDVIVEQEGGPAPVQPLVKYCEGHAKDLHSALKGSLMDAEGMISFLKTAGEAEFIGHAADAAGREDFLTRLSEAGGASVLYSSLKEIDLKALLPAIMPVARAAKLHRESCLQVPAGSISRADAWHKLVEIVETKWGGPQAFLEKSGELYDSQRASAHERREGSEFDALVQDTGGRMAVSELLRWTADAGGVQHVLRALGPVQLSQVCNFLEALRRGGGQFQDLEKLATMVREVGGLTRLVRSMEKIQDPSKLIEIIDYGSTFERHGFVDHAKDREKHPEVLAKVMAETSINRFLKIFDGVRLSSLLDLVPLLVSAGVLRSKGQAQGEEEVAAAGGSVLRWLARAGGAFLVGSAVSQVEARSFVKLMEQVNQMGLGQLRPLGMMKVGAFLTDLSRRAGSLEDFMTSVGQLDLIHLVSTLNSWRQPAPSEREDDVPEQATEDASGALENVRSEASDVAIPGPSTPEEAQEVLEALEALRVVAQKESVRGIQRLVKDFQKVDRLERLERGIELLDKARLLPRLGGTSSAPKSDFEPWSHLVSIVNAFGGPEDFNKRVEAVNLQHFDECLDVLNAAGLTRKPGQEAMNSRDFSSAVSAWKEVVGILVTAGGPALFLESLKGIAVEDFLRMVGLLRQAGLARPLDDEDGVEMTRRPSFSYGYGESAGRIRNEMLQDFVQRVIQAGGFHAFWHALKGVDLMKLKGDLHCLAVIRRKLQELIAEDWWLAVHDAEGLEELLHSALAERKRRADDLTLKQRQQLVKRFREVGGVEAFLDGFANINLSQMLQQHKALHKARIRDVGVIEALSKIGELVKNKVEHLHGLQAVAATLVRWGDRHYRGEEPVRLWKAMHQQVTWLLMAIEENGALLKATVNHGNHPGKEPELTPARLAQFLQALRPVGGVPGFLAAFRGLDFPMAAAQARILHDACVRSKETTKRLAVIFGLLRFNLTQLRGLEHFLRNFVAPVFAEASSQAQTSQERLLVAERWQRLTSYLSQAAGRAEPGQVTEEPASGADQVLEVLMLGLRLSEAAGRKASKEDWEQLCQEIRSDPGLPGLLEKIRSPRRVSRLSGEPRATRGSLSAPSAFLVRTTLPPCYEDGPPLLPDAPVPVLPVARRVSRPQSAARSRSQVEPFRSHPVPGWSETTQ